MKKKSAETRRRMSEARKKFWEKKTPEQRSKITLKGVDTRENSEAENKRRENISKKMREFYATPEGILAIKAGVNTYTELRDARSPERINELSRQKSESTKAVWDNLTVAQRAARVEKVNGGFKKIRFEGKHGNFVRSDSRWERGVYKLLQELEIPFWFSNEDSGCWFQLGSESEPKLMFPDFILKYRKLIIEVKGYGPAWDKLSWQIPAFIERYGKDYSYAICMFNPENHNYKSFDSFLKDLLWVHIAPKHKKWKYPCHLAEKLASNNRAISVDSETQKGWLLKEARRIPR